MRKVSDGGEHAFFGLRQVDQLVAEVDPPRRERFGAGLEERLEADLSEAILARKRLEEALAQYADPANWRFKDGNGVFWKIGLYGPEIAERALALGVPPR